MASSIDPKILDWLNTQFNPGGSSTGGNAYGAPSMMTDPTGSTWQAQMIGSSGGIEQGGGGPTLTGWQRDVTPGTDAPGTQVQDYSTSGDYQDTRTVTDTSFLQNWGPFMLAALPFAAAMSPAIAAALSPSAGAGGAASADALTAGGSTFGLNTAEAVAGGGTAVGSGAGGFGTAAGAAGSAAFPGAAASADIVAPAGLGSTAGTTAASLAGGASGASSLLGGASSLLPAVGNLVKGGLGLVSANQTNQAAQQGATTANPFGPYRDQYAKQLSALMADPSSITKQPGWEAGSQAVQRAGAAQGFTNSGNMATALQQYGGDFYNSTVTQLSNLAGANINPGTAGQIQATAGVNQSQAQGNAIGTLIQGASSLIPQLMTGG